MSMVPSTTRQAPSREIVVDAQPILDTARYEHMGRIATVITNSELVPESLCYEGTGSNKERLPAELVRSRVFLVVNQAVRWGMDPFSVLQSVSLVRGKLCYEGKLVSSVLDARLGVALDYEWDDKEGDQAGITVWGVLPDGRRRNIQGTVADWKTTGTGSPWGSPSKNRRQLAYRGSREWVRLWAPAVLLGVYTPDELADLQEAAREIRRGRMQPPMPPALTSAPIGEKLVEHEPAEQQEEQPADVDLKGNTDAPAEQQPAADQKAIKKTPPAAPSAKPDAKASEAPQDQTPVKKAPPIPPPNKAKAAPAQEQQPDDTDQTDWEAEVEAFDNACSSAETAEEIEEAKQAHEHLFALTTPKAIGDRVDQIVAAELERIGRQG